MDNKQLSSLHLIILLRLNPLEKRGKLIFMQNIQLLEFCGKIFRSCGPFCTEATTSQIQHKQTLHSTSTVLQGRHVLGVSVTEYVLSWRKHTTTVNLSSSLWRQLSWRIIHSARWKVISFSYLFLDQSRSSAGLLSPAPKRHFKIVLEKTWNKYHVSQLSLHFHSIYSERIHHTFDQCWNQVKPTPHAIKQLNLFLSVSCASPTYATPTIFVFSKIIREISSCDKQCLNIGSNSLISEREVRTRELNQQAQS